MTDRFGAMLRRRGAVVAATLLVAAAGVAAWLRLPVDAFPDVTNVQVMVLSRAPALGAEEVERRVTWPLEQSMSGLPRLRELRSLSRGGLSQVVAVFDDGTDPWFARQVAAERLQEARESLPPGVEAELAPLSTGLGEIFQYTLAGDSLSAAGLRGLQDWLVAPRLRAVRGVAEVNSFGGEVAEHHVVVDPDRLLKYGLTLRDVVETLGRENLDAGAGFVTRGWEQFYLVGRGRFAGPAEIGEVVLRARGGAAVLVRDVADVVPGAAVRQGAVTRDARGETVAGMVIMLRGENSRTVVARVKAEVERIRAALPDGATLDVFYDRTGLIEACIATVMHALLEGGLCVILVLFLFLAEARTALVVLLSLPLTFLASFLVMGASGLTANLMSLGGLAFSVGMVVDGTIVVVENARRHLAAAGPGADRTAVIAGAAREVARPVAFSILVIAIVLLPLLTLQGIEGRMFRPLALTMLIALLASIVVALAVSPALAHLALSAAPERRFGFVRRFEAGYERLLAAALRRPRRALAAAGATLALAAGLVPLMGTEFIPALDEGSLAINVVRLPNASLGGSVETAREIERRLLEFPEVATVVTKTGRAEISEDPMGPEQSDVFVMLRPRRAWGTGRDKPALVAAMSAELARIPGLRASFSQPIALRVNELVSGVKSDVAVKVFGSDLPGLKAQADRVAAALLAVPGARDVKVEQVTGMTEYVVEPDRAALSRHGLNVADVNDVLLAGLAGARCGDLVEGDRRSAIVVRLPESARADLEAVGRLLVPAPGGERVPLAAVARIVPREGPAQVSRENGMRRVVVEANVRGRDLGGFVAEARARLAPLEAELPDGWFLAWGGQFENQQRAMRRLALVVPAALVLVGALLWSALGTVRNAALVVLNLPFALMGGVLAAVAFGLHLSVSAAVAFIVLLGIAVQNGVVLLAFLRDLRARGLAPDEAAREGCRLRFRPLFMTALTSFIGHLPMLFQTGAGADIQKPLAIVVMGGIVTSTLLTLLVLPVVWREAEARRR